MQAKVRNQAPTTASTMSRADHACSTTRTPLNHPRRLTALAAAIAATLAIPILGCVPPKAAQRTIASNQHAITILAEAYATDLAWLTAHIQAELQTQRAILLGKLHRDFITTGVLTPTGIDNDALNDALTTSPSPTKPSANFPLRDEIIANTMTIDEARRFANDYALAAAMSSQRNIRDAMLATLTPVREHDRLAEELLAAFQQHASAIAGIFETVGANNDALIQFATDDPAASPTFTRRDFWVPVLDRIDDPLLRAGVTDLLDAITNPHTTPTPTTNEGSTP